MKKLTAILCGALAVVLIATMGVSLSLNVITLNKVAAIEENTKKEDNKKENGVVIAGRYEIKSTEQISDAYKSGNASALSDDDRQTLKTASDILKKIIKKDMSDYEKELAVYEWIYENIKHDDDMLVVVQDGSSDTYTPQGVLNSKKAVCVGYATTFRLFMQMLGIDCMVVHEIDLGHTWDLVKIGSGWYHTDLYFDTPSNKFSHFNLVDSMRQYDYSWDETIYPRTSSFEYCYAVKSAKELEDVYTLPKKIKKTIDDKAFYASYIVKNATEEQQAIISTMLMRIQDAVSGTEDYVAQYFDWNKILKGKDYIFYLSFTYPEEETPEFELSEKIQKKINKAIEKVFGEITYNYDEPYSEIDGRVY